MQTVLVQINNNDAMKTLRDLENKHFISIIESPDLLKKKENDWWDKLPASVQAEIDNAITDLDNGKGISHDEVMTKYSKWFTR